MESKVGRSHMRYYFLFAFLRWFLVILPQTGYIHPDEFFQSVEVLVGKFYEVENNPPWEFNSTFPIRSMAIPYFTVGQSIKFVRDMNYFAKEYFNITLSKTYYILVAPRLLMCALSFLVDYCLYKICVNNNEKYKSRLLVLSQSYVLIVYGTRTFSNTIELVLFAVLLYFVCESLTFTNILNRKREYINYRYEQSKSIAEKVKFHKLRLYLVSDSFRNCFVISSLTVCGFFNRPTFLAFAVIPVFFWLYRGIGSKSITVTQFHTRMVFFVFCSLPSFIAIIIIDSFYYGYITWGEIGMLDVSIDSFVFTPLNFIRYNLNSENLAQHGLHPRYLHVLVNIPLLFNVLGVTALSSVGYYTYLCFRGKYNLLPPVKSIKCLMVLSFLVPLLVLSYFPHQEPRFLIPVILPLIYLHGTTVLAEPENILVEVPTMSIKGKTASNMKNNSQSYWMFKVWVAFNGILLIFYGFIHQGGVLKVVQFLHEETHSSPISTKFHIVTSHVYSTPLSLLLQKSSKKLNSGNKNNAKAPVGNKVVLYDEGSKDLEMVVQKLKLIVEGREFMKDKPLASHNILVLVIPGSLGDTIEYLISKENLVFNKAKSFFPHISIEAFPGIGHYCLEFTAPFYSKCDILSIENYFKKLIDMCGLKVYVINRKQFL